MDPIEYDVYIGYREPSGRELAGVLSEGLARRGFRVFPGRAQATDVGQAGEATPQRGRDAGALAGEAPPERRQTSGAEAGDVLQAIDEIPDFVLVLTPHALDASAIDEHDTLRAEIAHAIETERNIVPVVARGYEHPVTLPPDLVRLRARHPVRFSDIRRGESIARVAHRLSSDASVDDRHMMRDAKRIGVAVGLLLVILLVIAAVRTLPGMLMTYLSSRPLAPMTLYWSAFGERPAGNGWTELAIKDGSPIVAGDQFRFVFSTNADGYAYVLSRDLRGQITVFFPGRLLKGGSRVRAGQIYTAPLGGGWWSEDEGVGADRLYVFASYDSIENLESLSDNREESPAERQALLDSTIEGLLDGKHGSTPSRVRTRTGRRVYRNLDFRPAQLTASAMLGNGVSVTHMLNAEQGLLSAMVEIRVGPSAK